MKKTLFSLFIFQIQILFGQNVSIEISDYSRNIDGKEYSTYQFVNSSYSSSRPTLVILTNKDLFLELSTKTPTLYKSKQEYTDVWILGITNFNNKNVSEVDKKIIENFLEQIIKYRADNSLPTYSLENLEANKIFIDNKVEICRYLICKNKL